MAFPSNWIPDVTTAIPENVSPCWVDIVGNDVATANNATYHQYPTIPPDDEFVFFRMRLNGSPITPPPPETPPPPIRFRENVWGVQILDIDTNEILFTARVNTSGVVEELQILDSDDDVIYSEDITLDTNVEVSVATTTMFPCPMADPDYFLDFRLPKDEFMIDGMQFDFDSSYILCYYTATQPQVINKEQGLCAAVNPPDKFLIVEKKIISGEQIIVVGEEETWVLRITVSNPSTEDVNDIVVTDTVNSNLSIDGLMPSAGTTAGFIGNDITWTIGTLMPSDVATLDITVTGSFDTTGCRVLDEGIVSSDLENDLEFRDCGVCVVRPEPPTRGIDLFAVIE